MPPKPKPKKPKLLWNYQTSKQIGQHNSYQRNATSCSLDRKLVHAPVKEDLLNVDTRKLFASKAQATSTHWNPVNAYVYPDPNQEPYKSLPFLFITPGSKLYVRQPKEDALLKSLPIPDWFVTQVIDFEKGKIFFSALKHKHYAVPKSWEDPLSCDVAVKLRNPDDPTDTKLFEVDPKHFIVVRNEIRTNELLQDSMDCYYKKYAESVKDGPVLSKRAYISRQITMDNFIQVSPRSKHVDTNARHLEFLPYIHTKPKPPLVYTANFVGEFENAPTGCPFCKADIYHNGMSIQVMFHRENPKEKNLFDKVGDHCVRARHEVLWWLFPKREPTFAISVRALMQSYLGTALDNMPIPVSAFRAVHFNQEPSDLWHYIDCIFTYVQCQLDHFFEPNWKKRHTHIKLFLQFPESVRGAIEDEVRRTLKAQLLDLHGKIWGTLRKATDWRALFDAAERPAKERNCSSTYSRRHVGRRRISGDLSPAKQQGTEFSFPPELENKTTDSFGTYLSGELDFEPLHHYYPLLAQTDQAGVSDAENPEEKMEKEEARVLHVWNLTNRFFRDGLFWEKPFPPMEGIEVTDDDLESITEALAKERNLTFQGLTELNSVTTGVI